MEYEHFIEKILTVLEKTPYCVLATASADGVVSAAQMCLVNDGLTVYFQTDESFEKVKNIRENPNVAINVGAFYFKGKAGIVGHPTKNPTFTFNMQKKHPRSYMKYTGLKSEVLIEVKLTECKIWGSNGSGQETITVIDLKKKGVKTIVCDTL